MKDHQSQKAPPHNEESPMKDQQAQQEPSIPASLVQEFPLNLLPSWIRNEIICVSKEVQAAVPIAGNLALAIISAALARRCYIQHRKQTEPLNIWTLSLAEPGERKTPVYQFLTEPVTNSVLKDNLLSDTTVPRFIRRLGKTGKLIALNDELVVLDQLTLNNQISPQSLLNAYNETSFSYDRCDINTIYLNKPSLTMALAGQPNIFKQHYNSPAGKTLQDNGFFDRMQIVLVDSICGQRVFPLPDNEDFDHTHRLYCNLVQNLIDNLNRLTEEPGEESSETPNEESSEESNEASSGNPHETPIIYFTVSTEAAEQYNKFLTAVEADIASREAFQPIRGWLSKCGGLVLRLAGILHIIESIESRSLGKVISEDVMTKAIKFAEYYRDQTLRWKNICQNHRQESTADYIFQYLRSQGETECKYHTLQQAVRGRQVLGKADDVKAVLKKLAQDNVITVHKEKTRGRPLTIIRLTSAESPNMLKSS